MCFYEERKGATVAGLQIETWFVRATENATKSQAVKIGQKTHT